MNVLGLTGGIAMGKSTVAQQFSALGAKVWHADAAVHRLLAPGGAAEEVVKHQFPAVVVSGRIDKKKLRELAFSQPHALEKLEKVVHPFVWQEQKRYIKQMQRLGAKTLIMEIPLLFETMGEARFDAVVVVTAPHFLQRLRALQRKTLTEERLHAVLARQMRDWEKRKRADFIVHTGLGKAYSFRQVKHIMQGLQ